MHAASVPRILRGGPDASAAIVPALARNVPEGVQRFEHGLDDPLSILRLLGIGFLFEKRPTSKRASLGPHLAGSNLPISVEVSPACNTRPYTFTNYICRPPTPKRVLGVHAVDSAGAVALGPTAQGFHKYKYSS